MKFKIVMASVFAAVLMFVFGCAQNPAVEDQGVTKVEKESETGNGQTQDSGGNENGNSGGSENGSGSSGGTTDTSESGGSSTEGGSGNGGNSENTSIEVSQDEIMGAFNLTFKGIRASEAVKKIQKGKFSGIDVTDVEVISYDDEKGDFSVEVGGSKGGKPFTTLIYATGFSHPYNSGPRSRLSDNKLDFSDAIEENMDIASFVSKIKKNPSEYLTYRAILENGTEISVGETKDYVFSPSFEAKEKSVGLNLVYNVKFASFKKGDSEELVVQKNVSGISNVMNVDYPYFSEKQVFTHVMSAIKDEILNVDGEKFASEFYANAMLLKSTPYGLLNSEAGSKFFEYAEKYKAGGYMTIPDMQVGVYRPGEDGISADDYNGSVKVNYFVQRSEKLLNNELDGLVPLSVEKSGFMKVSAEFLKSAFVLTKGGASEEEAKDKWIKSGSPNSVFILRENSAEPFETRFTVESPSFLTNSTSSWYLTINESQDFAESIALPDDQFCSRITNGGKDYLLLIKTISVNKAYGDRRLSIMFDFEGNPSETGAISIELEPFGHLFGD